MKTINKRIFLSTINDSIHVLKFEEKEKQFMEFADDILPRFVSSSEVLDFNTVAMGDKFGNLAILRLPETCHKNFTENLGSLNNLWN